MIHKRLFHNPDCHPEEGEINPGTLLGLSLLFFLGVAIVVNEALSLFKARK